MTTVTTTAYEGPFPDETSDAYEQEDDARETLEREANAFFRMYEEQRAAFRAFSGEGSSRTYRRGANERKLRYRGKLLLTWEANVLRLRDLNLSPDSYLRLVSFAAVAGLLLFPYPHTLLDSKTIRTVQRLAPRRTRQAEVALRSQVQAAARAIRLVEGDPYVRAVRVAADDGVPLTPLFRLVLVYDTPGDLGVRARQLFFPEARAQYLCDPDIYDQVWGSHLPEKFRSQARQNA